MSGICDRCGKEFDIANLANNGSSALMITFCHGHNTSMSNVSYCPECTDLHILPCLRMLSIRGNVGIVVEEDL